MFLIRWSNTGKYWWNHFHEKLLILIFLKRLVGSERKSISRHRLTVFSSCCVWTDWQKVFEQEFLDLLPRKRVTKIGLILLDTLKTVFVKIFPKLFPKLFPKRVALDICLFTTSLFTAFTVLEKSCYNNAYNQNNLTPFCNNCKSKRETILHALYECIDKYKIWKYFFEIIKKLSSAAKMTSTNCALILNALVKDKKTRKVLLTIHITILSERWKARNLLKHQTKSLTNDAIIKKIKTKLRE